MARGPFRGIGTVGFHFLIDLLADVHDARDLGTAREVILVAYRNGLETRGEMFRIVVVASGHPASGFDGAGDHVVIGILFVMRPWIPTTNCIYLEQPNQKDDAAD